MILPKFGASKDAEKTYDKFIAKLIYLTQQYSEPDLEKLIYRYLDMSNESSFQQIDKLKSWLDSFRTLSAIAVAELKKLYDVQFTYNSNVIT